MRDAGMTSSILVGVDPLHDDGGPVNLAGVLARTTGAPVVVVAAHRQDTLLGRTASPAFKRATAEDAARALGHARETLEGITVTTRAVPADSPARAIHEVATAFDAGVVVVGSKRGGPVGRLLPGGVTDQVLCGAQRPVAIAPRGYVPPRRVVHRLGVAFVDTPEGREALCGAVALARSCGATVEAFTMLDPTLMAMYGWPGAVGAELSTDPVGELERSQRAAIADTLGRDHDEVRATVLADGRLGGLAEASAPLDLLVTGSRGYGPVRMVLLGSVSHWLARIAGCPLLVLPRGAGDVLESVVAAPEEAMAP